jgi:predicted RND superfamily exporter protein
MGILSRAAVRHPKRALAAWLIIVTVAAVGAGRLRQEDDLLAFLPSHDPDVRLFQEVSHRFGGLRVGLIGVETPAGQDLFSAGNLDRIRTATETIRNLDGIDRVLSLTTVTDPVVSNEGVDLRPLVPGLPADERAANALRDKVLARDHVAGSLVSRDGRAAVIMAFFADGASDRVLTQSIRHAAQKTLAPLTIYYGGAPFYGRAVYEEAQRDIRWLSPLALLVLLLVVVLSFRDLVGVLLTVASVSISTLVVLGAMGFAKESYNAATSTLPVILFASGSSYAVHILGRYYLERARSSSRDAILQALAIAGPPVAIAGATTAVGFLSFVFTDVHPMRVFGLACGGGVLVCWLTSLTLVPAVLAIWPRRAVTAPELRLLGAALVAVWHGAQKRRVWILVTALIVGAAAIRPMRRVAVRMEPRAFFRPGSEPARAGDFLDERFGGATFVQVALHGDFDDPATLRELDRLADYARSLPGVTQVQAITQPLVLIDEVMGGGRRLPVTRAQASNLFFFLDGEPGLRALVTPDRHDALVHVRLKGEARPVVDALEQFAATELHHWPELPVQRDVAERLGWIASGAGHPAPPARIAKAIGPARLPAEDDPAWMARKAELERSFTDGDAALLPPEAHARQLAEARRDVAVHQLMPPLMARLGIPESESLRVAMLLDDLFLDGPRGFQAQIELRAQVAGEPVLSRGFSRSVAHNLDVSLAVSIAMVLSLLYLLFRSVKLSIICMFPSLLTLATIFAVMGIADISIDLGTSLVAGIATGAGSDFAMHYLWYLRRQSADEVTRSVGPIMVVSVLLVALGFLVLAFGRSPVMQLLGTLAGLTMGISALLTCLIVPALRPAEE